MEVNGQLLESGADAAALLEPADALLDHVPLTISLLIEGHGRVVSHLLVVLVRDHRLDAQELEPVADAFDAVTLVAGQLLGLAAPAVLAEAINLAMIGSRRVDSCTCPAVTSTANGVPRPSVTRWNLVPNPPRLRPNAWSLGSSGCHWRLLFL